MPSMLCGFPSGVYDWPAYICLWCLFLGCALASNEVCIWLLLIYGFFALPKVGSVFKTVHCVFTEVCSVVRCM